MADTRAALHGCSYVLAHVPDLVRYGSKPQRDALSEPDLPQVLAGACRTYAEAAAYLPHRVFLGAADPDALGSVPRPWWSAGARSGLEPESGAAAAALDRPWGELLAQNDFYRLLLSADTHGLVALFSAAGAGAARRAGTPRSAGEARDHAAAGEGLVLYAGSEAAGFVRRDHEIDPGLQADVLLENLAAKATGAWALRRAIDRAGLEPGQVDYVLGCGEEAVGDRYQRGGGSLGKAIAEQAGCLGATGADVKAFCCGPLHALVLAGAAVVAGVHERVAVVGGSSLAKLGMKYRGHLAAGMPVLEDVLAGFALLVGRDDGAHPVLDLAHVGRHPVGAGSSPVHIYEALVAEPLRAAGLSMGQVDRYATELHNPEITEPAGSGDVPGNNNRLLAALAVRAGEISAGEMDGWVRRHGLAGWSPTQGHVASAVPYVGHALRRMAAGREANVLLVGKGSLFLGRMTQMSDGVSLLLRA